MTFRKPSRLPLVIVACAALGVGVRPCAAQPPVSPAQSASPAKVAPEGGLQRLKSLVESAEKAAQAEDWEAESAAADEAENLLGTWPPERLDRSETAALLERLKVVEDLLDEASGPEEGLKMTEESVTLAGEDLRIQLEKVKAAEQDAVFDFPIDLNEKVLSWVYEFTHGKRGFVEGALSRATRYLPMVRQVFQEEGVPQDLAYLALIESGFKNTARSHAQAVGMWQFIRSTGRIYGLTGSAWIEERRDPVKSCRAAARYLRHLYEASGDWYLALAGYNAGPLTLERAGSALGTRNFWDMARSRYLRNETKQYVPKLMAAILVGRFPERYGLNVVQMPPFTFETVDVDRMTSLSILAAYAGTDAGVLEDLNPELLRSTTPPGRYMLRVPPGTSGAASRALARIPSERRLDFQTYLVRKSDTLAGVAARFRMSPRDLLQANNLTRKQFRAGRRIKVPPPSTVAIDGRDLTGGRDVATHTLADLPTLPADRTMDLEPAVPKGPGTAGEEAEQAPPARPESAARPAFHVVKRGETVFSIAERYGLRTADLKKWNRIRRNRIVVGQRLRLRQP